MQVNQTTISIVSIILFVSVVFPVWFMYYLVKKRHIPFKTIGIGIAVWFLFTQIIEKLLHSVVLQYTPITTIPWAFAIYFALSESILDEFGRFLGFTKFLKGKTDTPTAVGYATGFAGIEMLLLGGIASLQILLLANMLNTGTFNQLQGKVPDQVYQSIQSALQGPWYEFAISGLERVAQFILQFGLTFIVLRSIRTDKYKYLIYAILLHFVVKFAPALPQLNVGNIWTSEILFFALAIASGVYLYRFTELKNYLFHHASLEHKQQQGNQEDTNK